MSKSHLRRHYKKFSRTSTTVLFILPEEVGSEDASYREEAREE